MRKHHLSALALALALFVSAPALASESRDLSGTFSIEPGMEVELDLKIGDLEIVAGDGDEILVDLRARCRGWFTRCDDRLEDLELRLREYGDRVVLSVRGDSSSWSGRNISLDGEIVVPRAAALTIDMGIGDLEVEGFEHDVTVDMGIGDLTIHVPGETLRSVHIDTGIGDASMHGASSFTGAQGRTFLGKEISWHREEGSAEVEVDLGIGDVSVYLD